MQSQKQVGLTIKQYSFVFEFGLLIFAYFGIAKGIHVEKFHRVPPHEEIPEGQSPQNSIIANSKTACVAFASHLDCKLLSFQEKNSKCTVYTQRAPVRSVTIDEIFYGKEHEDDFIFNALQNTWYKVFSCNCLAVTAITICENQNARLIYINSPARQQFLENLLQGKTGHYLIDGNDYNRDDVFTHSNGAVLTYFNWKTTNPQEPSRDPAGEDCLTVCAEDNFMWHDVKCDGWILLNGVICEIPP